MSGYPNARTPGTGAGQALTAKRSVRILDPQGGTISSPTAGTTNPTPQVYDPPRSPREGYEWVWFPAGYWAERAIVQMPSLRKPESSTWPFRWSNKRTAKESIGTQDSPEDSPGTPTGNSLSPPLFTPKPRQMPPLASPYLSEAAHVQSLQGVSMDSLRRKSSDEFPLMEMGATGNTSRAPLPTPSPVGPVKDSNLPRWSYFQFAGSSEDSVSPSAIPLSSRISKPSLGSKSSNVAHLSPLRGPSSTHLGRPSSESVVSATTSDGIGGAPKDAVPSPAISLGEAEPGTQQPIIQTEAPDASKLATPNIRTNEKHRQSFMRRLIWETKPKLKKAQPQPRSDFDTVASILAEVKPRLPVPPLSAPTGHVTSMLQDNEKGNPPSKTQPRKLFKKKPKSHRTSVSSSISASGSVRDWLKGRSSEAIPSIEVEAYIPPSELYPGGEARRLQTPPLRETTSDGHPRSFFFDITTPRAGSNDVKRRRLQQPQQQQQQQQHQDLPRPSDDSNYGFPYSAKEQDVRQRPPQPPRSKRPYLSDPEGKRPDDGVPSSPPHHLSHPPHPPPPPPPSTAINQHHRPLKRSQAQESSGSNNFVAPSSLARQDTAAANQKEWWEVPVPIPNYEDMAPAAFAFDLPEHLPTSPMCPANKKHRSGGTGVCVYHGRRKRSFDDGDDDDHGGDGGGSSGSDDGGRR